MDLRDIWRFAEKYGVTISFNVIDHPYKPQTLNIIVRKETYSLGYLIRPDDFNNDEYIEYLMDRMTHDIEKYINAYGHRLCANCGNRMCKDAYPCEDMKNNVKYCIETNRSLWVPIIKKEKQNDQT